MNRKKHSETRRWQFWIDRGGTFTDVVGRSPDGQIHSAKYLSENPEQYKDAAIFGIRKLLADADPSPWTTDKIEVVKMGTTVGTNALLERRGERVALLVTEGFGDLLHIGYQHRRDLFRLHIQRPLALYESVHEIRERIDANGVILTPLDEPHTRRVLKSILSSGVRTVAIVLLHGYRNGTHENRIADIAVEMGFHHISVSHRISPSIKAISRGDTTVVDAYLSPLLKRYVSQVQSSLHTNAATPDGGMPSLMFMQSHGGLIDAAHFQGKDSILSGPAGGIVGAVTTCRAAGYHNVITFDMGGTSTDVAHFNGEYELNYESEIADVRLQCPMLNIHTVAAGGGSILKFSDGRCQVGPESAGASPGPASYRRGGPPTVTDCNVVLKKILPEYFPKVFGPSGDESLDRAAAVLRLETLTDEINRSFGTSRSVADIAEGFLDIAVENMAQAIKRISVQRGYNVREYTLCCFGGAGGQHACRTADVLGMTRVFIHPEAGVLSALGMGLADNVVVKERSVLLELVEENIPGLHAIFEKLNRACATELSSHFRPPVVYQRLLLRYSGTDSPLSVPFGAITQMRKEFEEIHRNRFGFVFNRKPIEVAKAVCEVRQGGMTPRDASETLTDSYILEEGKHTRFFTGGKWLDASIFLRHDLHPGAVLTGPCIIIEPNSTIVVEPGWQATLHTAGHFFLTRHKPLPKTVAVGTDVDPVFLELFNNRFMNVAEQMGYTLQNTAASVNIRERLDFSCAVFDAQGNLVANAPHIPVHLGSMSPSVRAIIEKYSPMEKGDVFLLNSPYHGGTHLPDLTVVTPVFAANAKTPLFFVASRGHHADVGGTTPGSIPPDSVHIDDEGILFDGIRIAHRGEFQEAELQQRFLASAHPARDVQCNIADISAQVAANAKGDAELCHLVSQFGTVVVTNYMTHVQNNAAASVREVLTTLQNGAAEIEMDTGDRICVSVHIDQPARTARIDFTGTSPQNPGHNFNAPLSITHAAVLYVFRTLTRDIPLNSGCLIPLEIIVPEGCILHPGYPMAVVAGNVETSQHIVDVLLQALGKLAGSQGTMNNLTFGNYQYQYYETICGGSGAGQSFHGTDAIQCHMTNSRITDPEVLESRFPVKLEQFSVRHGSGGPGRFNGGNGAIRRIAFKEPLTVSIVSSHRVHAPRGLFGGQNGAPGKNSLQRADGTQLSLGGCDTVDVFPGDILTIETPGGGGFKPHTP